MKNQIRFLPAIIYFVVTIVCGQTQPPELVVQAGHTAEIYATAFSPDNKTFATAGEDKTIKLWDIKTGKLIKTLIGHEGSIHSIAFSPDGKWLVSGGEAVTHDISFQNKAAVMIWNVATGKSIGTTADQNVTAVAFSQNGKWIYSNGPTFFTKWDATTGKAVKAINQGGVNALAISNGGKYLATSFNEITLLDAETLEKKDVINAYADYLGFSKDDQFLVIIDRDGNTKLYDILKKELSANFNAGKDVIGKKIVNGIAFDIIPARESNREGTLQAVRNYEENSVAIINTSTKQLVQKMQITNDPFTSFSFSGDGRLLAVSGNKRIRTFDWKNTEAKNSTIAHSQTISHIAFDNTGTSIFSSAEDSMLIQWNAADLSIRNSRKMHGNVLAFDLDPKNPVAVGATHAPIYPGAYDPNPEEANDTLFFLDIKKNEFLPSRLSEETREEWGARVSQISFSKTGNIFGAATAGNLHLFQSSNHSLLFSKPKKIKHISNLSTGAIRTYRTEEEEAFLSGDCFAISPHEKFAASGTLIGILNVMNLSTTPKEIFRFDGFSKESPLHWQEINSIDFHPNDDIFATGSSDNSIKLWSALSKKYIRTLYGHSSDVTQVKFADDGKLLFSISKDNSLKIWEPATGKEIATYVLQNNGIDYIVFTPDGYYRTTKNGSQGVHFVYNNTIYFFDQFDLQFNRPDIVCKRLGCTDVQLISAYNNAWKKRVKSMGFTPGIFEDITALNASVVSLQTSINQETTEKTMPVSITVEDKKYPIDRINVYVNGVAQFGKRGFSVREKNSSTIQQTVSIDLSDGKNIIELSAMNDHGVESLKERFEVLYKGEQRIPNVYVIAIGVSEFADSTYNITYAAKDAKDIGTFFKNSTNGGSVTVKTILNKEATKENMTEVKNLLLTTTVNDIVIVAVASHGILDNDFNYYLATADMNFNSPSSNGLLYEDFENVLDGIPARKKLVLIDACNSGEVDKDESKLIAANETFSDGVKARGFKKVVNLNNTLGLKNSFELMKEMFTDLRKGTGAVVISSASGKEFAFESSEWNNGVFTYAFLDGLKSGKADIDKDSVITVSEIRDYVSRRVMELTGGKQNPTTRSENLENDFIVW